MSFKDDLERRQQADADAKAKDEALRQQRMAKRRTQADVLEKYLKDKGVQELGLKLESVDTRVKLQAKNFEIHIDPDLETGGYQISKLVSEKTGHFNLLKAVDKRTARTLDAVGECILD